MQVPRFPDLPDDVDEAPLAEMIRAEEESRGALPGPRAPDVSDPVLATWVNAPPQG